MEKFGIFELLDALAALTAHPANHAQTAPEENGAKRSAPPAAHGGGDDAPAADARSKPEADGHAAEADALAAFLARHDAMSRRIK